jgi:hypothetical protein
MKEFVSYESVWNVILIYTCCHGCMDNRSAAGKYIFDHYCECVRYQRTGAVLHWYIAKDDLYAVAAEKRAASRCSHGVIFGSCLKLYTVSWTIERQNVVAIPKVNLAAAWLDVCLQVFRILLTFFHLSRKLSQWKSHLHLLIDSIMVQLSSQKLCSWFKIFKIVWFP